METAQKTKKGKRLVKLVLILLVVLVLTNPSIIPILPASWRDGLYNVWFGLFGDVGVVTNIVKINWVSIFQVIVIVLFMMILYDLVKIGISKIKPKTNKGISVLSIVDSVLTYAAVLITVIWCLNAIGVNLSTIFASLGIIALIIGFAAESLIEDLIIGIFLAFEDEFNIGDIIEFNGFRGTVTKIGIRVTCITNPGGNVLMVNNSDIRTILNKSKSKSKAVCDIPISYAAKLEEAEKVLKEIMSTLPDKYPDIFIEAPTYSGVQELAESSVNLRFVASVDEGQIFDAQRLMNREAKIGMDEANLEIPFAQIVVHQE